jgi:hypothetical protein
MIVFNKIWNLTRLARLAEWFWLVRLLGWDQTRKFWLLDTWNFHFCQRSQKIKDTEWPILHFEQKIEIVTFLAKKFDLSDHSSTKTKKYKFLIFCRKNSLFTEQTGNSNFMWKISTMFCLEQGLDWSKRMHQLH